MTSNCAYPVPVAHGVLHLRILLSRWSTWSSLSVRCVLSPFLLSAWFLALLCLRARCSISHVAVRPAFRMLSSLNLCVLLVGLFHFVSVSPAFEWVGRLRGQLSPRLDRCQEMRSTLMSEGVDLRWCKLWWLHLEWREMWHQWWDQHAALHSPEWS